MNTEVLRRFKELGGNELLGRLIDLHIERSRRVLNQIEEDCRGNRFDDARYHASKLQAFAEEVGQEEVIPFVRQLRRSLVDGTLGDVFRDLHRMREGVHLANEQLTSAKPGS